VRAMAVVVRDVLVQNRPQMPQPGDQHPVGGLGSCGAHPALGYLSFPAGTLKIESTWGVCDN
jgi:hypothetical protein